MNEGQKEHVRRVFTERADSYTAHKPAIDQESYEWMLKLSRVESHHRVLDAATGTGFIALLFAERAHYVVGVDLTRALLRKAKALQRERELLNADFVEGEVGAIPARSESFDLVTCHKAFHHFPEAERALAEMHRALRPGGRLVLGDTLSSENSEKSALHNRLERLRDPSHVKMYPLSELTAMIERAGFQTEEIAEFQDERDFETWMAMITPLPEVIEEIREIMLASVPEDRTGQQLRVDAEKLYYTRFAAVVAATKT